MNILHLDNSCYEHKHRKASRYMQFLKYCLYHPKRPKIEAFTYLDSKDSKDGIFRISI
jgi:hypothetical protein